MLSVIFGQSHVTYPQPLSTYFSDSFSRRQNFVTFPFSASQLANTAYVIQFSFLILSGIILLTYVFSLLTCRIIYIKSHRYTFLISWFRYFRIPERLLPSPGILSGYPSSAISHQRPHVSPEALRGTGGHPSFHIPSLSVAYPVHIYRCRLIFHKSTSGFLCLIIQC